VLASCRYFLWNRVVGFVIPKDLSDVGGRILLLTSRHDVPAQQAAASVLLDRTFDLAVPLLLLGPAAFYLAQVIDVQTFAVTLLLLALGAGGALALAGKAGLGLALGAYGATRERLSGSLPVLGRLPPLEAGLPVTDELLARAFGLSVVKFAATALRFFCYARAISLDASIATFVAGTPITQLSFLLALTPGGLGVLEATWYGILTYAGVAQQGITTFVVAQRLLTMGLVGVVLLLLEARCLLDRWKGAGG
jgi:uncharacterized membrane protein YbhN (UPF0104 family)